MRSWNAGTELQVGPLGRLGIVLGELRPVVTEVDTMAPRAGDSSDTLAHGKYLATTMCTECHGSDLRGGKTIPDLAIAGAYTESDFLRLMRTGVPIGGRELTLMKEVAIGRFSHLSDPEVAALHVFLKRRAAEVASANH